MCHVYVLFVICQAIVAQWAVGFAHAFACLQGQTEKSRGDALVPFFCMCTGVVVLNFFSGLLI
jgi:hypothetical protein